jgi:8-oxo-dGTP pyrophosphatase MutT (NUDIX family)
VSALPLRPGKRGWETLIVQTRRGKWTAPKGWPEPSLSLPEAAAREAWEEGGVKGVVGSLPAGRGHYRKRLRNGRKVGVNALIYPMLVKEEAKRWPEMWRARRWASLKKALKQMRGQIEIDDAALFQWLRALGHDHLEIR